MQRTNHTPSEGNVIRSLARRSPRKAVQASAAIVLSLALTYGGGIWLQSLHAAEGATGHNDPPFFANWLKDATLALPLVFLAVCAAILFARRLLRRYGDVEPSRMTSGAVLSVVVAISASAAMVAAKPIYDAIFNGYSGWYGMPLYLYLGRDLLLALVAGVPISALVIALLRGEPWAAPRPQPPPGLRRRRRIAQRRRLAFQWLTVSCALALPVAVMVVGSIEQTKPAVAQVAQAAPNTSSSVCPAGAPVKSFDVQAIDVDIPLNRFGDHDPEGHMYALSKDIPAIRAQEAGAKRDPVHNVSVGLRDDPIQPLVIRANEGDCVKVHFTNNASGGDYGLHIDGLSFDAASSGDAIGNNPSSAAPKGSSRDYTYFVPDDPTAEGAHYMHPGPGNREQVSHGLLGQLNVEPPGSTYTSIETGEPLDSGWEASISPAGKAAFREYSLIYHEVGNEKYKIKNAEGGDLPTNDPHTDSYRPGSKAINYRSEPFMNRLDKAPKMESVGYSSYTFSDPATPMPRSYLGDPTKIRLAHGGSEMFHVHHMHGGGIRWRFNPVADTTYDYADTGLDKHPKTEASPSARLDSQAIGPGESYNLEIEGGSGGVQKGAGEFLFHCHISNHYVSGMWSFWRVYNTAQPDLAPLVDRQPRPEAVDSAGLIGKTINGTTITKDNLDDWIRPQLPTQGVPKDDQDASVWNWTIDKSDPDNPIYLGEPEDKGPWPDLPNQVPGHPGAFPGDQFVGPQDRTKIMFDPTNGRPAFPLLRPHIGQRPPFSGNGHTGAPYLGETGDQPSNAPPGGADPFANRADGICPAGAPVRHYNVIALALPIQTTKKEVDSDGRIYVLAQDKEDILAGRKPAEPLAIRSNIGECVAVTLTSELRDDTDAANFSKVNMHIHHVQFDTQASDGVITGFEFEQSIRPFKFEDPKLAAAAGKGDTSIKLTDVSKFQKGVWIGVGLGTEGIEVQQIDSIDPANKTVTLKEPLKSDHASGQAAGVEFVQYRWYPDVQLDNIFWHDHVDAIHSWGHGLVGQLMVEPRGSTYHDPTTGAETNGAGTITDIRTNSPLAEGIVDGSYRELALWEIDENPNTDSTINIHSEPWADRGGDPSLRFSSYAHGDPATPLPRAYPGDPFVIRGINVSEGVDTLHVDGHRFFYENRYVNDKTGEMESSPIDTVHIGVSERFTLILEGGAGGVNQKPGDYLYFNGIGRRFQQGAWGIIRVLPGLSSDLKPLPGTSPPSGGALPQKTGGRPPAAQGPGNPCPAGAPQRDFKVSAVDIKNKDDGREFAFVPSSEAQAVKNGKMPEPLVMHVAAGECVNVLFKNESSLDRASFHVGKLDQDPRSSGVNVGFNPEQTAAPGQTKQYRYFADNDRLGSALVSDFGGDDSGKDGLYGAVVVAPKGATFTDPKSGKPTDVGTQVDVHVASQPNYRDFTLAFSEDDPRIGQNTMPYPENVDGPALVNYQMEPRPNDTNNAFSSKIHGDPKTPILQAYAGDPMRVHALLAPGSEQMHVFNLGGLSWPIDPKVGNAEEVESRAFGPWESVDAHVVGGAGGRAHTAADFFYGDMRRPFTQAGMWGLMRVLPESGCTIQPLNGGNCVQPAPNPAPDPTPPPDPGSDPDQSSSLSLNAASATLDFGKSTTLSGRLTNDKGNPLSREDVTLKHRPVGAGNFTRVDDATTDADGNFSFTGVKPDENTDYQVSFAGDEAARLQPSTSPAKRLNVRALVSIRASTKNLSLGKRRTISGGVSPDHKGKVTLTVKRGKKVVLRKPLALRRSHYSFSYKPGRAGRYTVGVGFATHADHMGNRTPARSFRVLRR